VIIELNLFSKSSLDALCSSSKLKMLFFLHQLLPAWNFSSIEVYEVVHKGRPQREDGFDQMQG